MRSTGRRSLSIGLVALLALLVSATSAVAATIPIKGGEVNWGIRESFRKYIEGPIAKGKIEVSDGAVRAADGTFVFPVGTGTYDTTTHTTEVVASGTVHFTGHEGALDVTFSNPRVVLGAGTGTVFAHVGSEDVEFASLDPSGVTPVIGTESVALSAIPAVLTEAGSKAFAGFLKPGTALDPLGVTASFVPPKPPVEAPKAEPQKPADNPPAPAPPAPASPSKPVASEGVQKFGANGVAKVASLACPSGGATCTTTVPKRLGAKIAGKRYVLGVMAPKKIGAGKSASVRVHVPKAAREALGAGKYQVKLPVAVHANGLTAKQVVKVKIAGRG